MTILTKKEIEDACIDAEGGAGDGEFGFYGSTADKILRSHEELRDLAISGWECALVAAIALESKNTERRASEVLEKLRSEAFPDEPNLELCKPGI